MKTKKKGRGSAKGKDLTAPARRARTVTGGALGKTVKLSPPSPPAGPVPIPYPN